MLAAVQDAYATGRFMGGLPARGGEPVIPQPVRDFDTPEAYAMRAAFDAPPAALYFRPPTWKDLWCGLWQSLYKTPTGAYWLGVSVATVGWTTYFLLFR